jgi:hypothetical protein
MRWMIVAVAVLGLYAFSVVGQSHPVISSTSSGRYQVVNGTPELSKNIMLLDSATGQSWIICNGDNGAQWCRMFVTDDSTIPRK